jgi:hypothetical protein
MKSQKEPGRAITALGEYTQHQLQMVSLQQKNNVKQKRGPWPHYPPSPTRVAGRSVGQHTIFAIAPERANHNTHGTKEIELSSFRLISSDYNNKQLFPKSMVIIFGAHLHAKLGVSVCSSRSHSETR